MKSKYPILFLLILFTSKLCFAQLNPKEAEAIIKFKGTLSKQVETDNVHGGISFAVLKHDKIIYQSAVGYARHDEDVLTDTTNIYRIGSITKIFTSVLMMQLVEEGKFKLDDPVENYLPEIKTLKGYADLGSKITYRQLASHTAGLKREPDMSNASVGPLDQWEQKLLLAIPKTGFVGKPAGQFLYSNMGVAILGLAMERITGVSYMQMLQDRIFTPLHMTDTFFALPDDKHSRLAEGIENSNDKINLKLPTSEIKGRGYRVPNGGIFSTTADLAKFAFALQGKPPLLKPESLKEMRTVPEGGKDYGLGLFLNTKNGKHLFGHDGSTPGYTSGFLIDGDTGYAVILMRNYNKGETLMLGTPATLLKELKEGM